MLLLLIIYLAFISLGLPDAVLGSTWPVAYVDLNSSLEFAGVISIVISAGTVISSLLSSRLIHRFSTGKVMVVSVLLTALALLGFAFSQSVWTLVLLAIPLGLGGGAVDAALNNFVALHYKSKHMNYLHSFWGVGATSGPLIMAIYLNQDQGWREGFEVIAAIQFALVLVLLLSISLWSNVKTRHSAESSESPHLISNTMAFRIKGVKLQLLTFFCYCSLEAGTGLWAASFLITVKGVEPTQAAFWTSMYFLGITLGRFFSGFIADYVKEENSVRVGIFTILLGVVLMALPGSLVLVKLGLVLVGLGCAPIYPNTIHLTPKRFGEQASQTIIGLSMATAYVGTTLIPPLLGLIAVNSSFQVLPMFLLFFVVIMLWSSQRLRQF
ncbi:MFS transporter [Alginatibacterium sediminis]|uniref:MFS transporter n=1 Tax=Alginatibacterium sediminis TaxID=2164068 RepID=A0A420E793_9ALTE|nr:MFS transporter [Alginatibacterium sediminis]RKF14288.1 MFS transporter [Alginatibacterium sediminis]